MKARVRSLGCVVRRTASAIGAAALITTLLIGSSAFAQRRQDNSSPKLNSDNTLEIAPRVETPPAPAPANHADANPSGVENTQAAYAPPRHKRPYLGIGVQYIYTHKSLGQIVQGLEVVSVDPGSPAERAGLHGRGTLTKIGASGATAGALVPPLDLIMMPLLKKAGQLGRTGDLIVAIDDHRVNGEGALSDALARLKPGDVVYFTVIRAMRNGSYKTLKLPVTLGNPDGTVASRGGPTE
ncbi:MAG: PDZ domain-containing protein [Candidatus Binataceae bacterium]